MILPWGGALFWPPLPPRAAKPGKKNLKPGLPLGGPRGNVPKKWAPRITPPRGAPAPPPFSPPLSVTQIPPHPLGVPPLQTGTPPFVQGFGFFAFEAPHWPPLPAGPEDLPGPPRFVWGCFLAPPLAPAPPCGKKTPKKLPVPPPSKTVSPPPQGPTGFFFFPQHELKNFRTGPSPPQKQNFFCLSSPPV